MVLHRREGTGLAQQNGAVPSARHLSARLSSSTLFEALQFLGERLQDFGGLSRRHGSVGGRKRPAAIVCLDMLPDAPIWCWQIGVDMEQGLLQIIDRVFSGRL